MSLSMTFPLRIREAASDEHPLARLALHGANTLSDAELITLLLGTSDQSQTQQMLTDVGGLTGLQRLSIDELQQLTGIVDEMQAPPVILEADLGPVQR